MRWMRTNRALRPGSFPFLFVTFTLPLGLLGLAVTPAGTDTPVLASLFATTLAVRLALYVLPRLAGNGLGFSDIWLLPLRDLLLCWIWLRSFFTSRVSWRGGEFNVDDEGVMRTL
jgi:ceramide glucosyltransferase